MHPCAPFGAVAPPLSSPLAYFICNNSRIRNSCMLWRRAIQSGEKSESCGAAQLVLGVRPAKSSVLLCSFPCSLLSPASVLFCVVRPLRRRRRRRRRLFVIPFCCLFVRSFVRSFVRFFPSRTCLSSPSPKQTAATKRN